MICLHIKQVSGVKRDGTGNGRGFVPGAIQVVFGNFRSDAFRSSSLGFLRGDRQEYTMCLTVGNRPVCATDKTEKQAEENCNIESGPFP